MFTLEFGIFVIGCYIISIIFLINTSNKRSTLVFKVFPLFSGMYLLFYSAVYLDVFGVLK